MKACIWFPLDLKEFYISEPVLVKTHHFAMGTQFLFFIITTGKKLKRTQGNTCKKISELCVCSLLEFRERKGSYFLIIPHRSSISTHLRVWSKNMPTNTQSNPTWNSLSSFPLPWDLKAFPQVTNMEQHELEVWLHSKPGEDLCVFIPTCMKIVVSWEFIDRKKKSLSLSCPSFSFFPNIRLQSSYSIWRRKMNDKLFLVTNWTIGFMFVFIFQKFAQCMNSDQI